MGVKAYVVTKGKQLYLQNWIKAKLRKCENLCGGERVVFTSVFSGFKGYLFDVVSIGKSERGDLTAKIISAVLPEWGECKRHEFEVNIRDLAMASEFLPKPTRKAKAKLTKYSVYFHQVNQSRYEVTAPDPETAIAKATRQWKRDHAEPSLYGDPEVDNHG